VTRVSLALEDDLTADTCTVRIAQRSQMANNLLLHVAMLLKYARASCTDARISLGIVDQLLHSRQQLVRLRVKPRVYCRR
jgi:hypothetical protein